VRGASLAIAAALAAASSACGYSSKRLVSEPGVSSIAIQQFDNKTFRRDLEFRLTQAVAQEVRARTSWRIATEGTADAVLSGTIREAEESVLTEQRNTNDPVLKRFRATVDVKLVARSSGRVLREWTVDDRVDFTPDRFDESLEGSATDRLVRLLAEQVVEALETPIGDPSAVPPKPIDRTSPWRPSSPSTRPR